MPAASREGGTEGGRVGRVIGEKRREKKRFLTEGQNTLLHTMIVTPYALDKLCLLRHGAVLSSDGLGGRRKKSGPTRHCPASPPFLPSCRYHCHASHLTSILCALSLPLATSHFLSPSLAQCLLTLAPVLQDGQAIDDQLVHVRVRVPQQGCQNAAHTTATLVACAAHDEGAVEAEARERRRERGRQRATNASSVASSRSARRGFCFCACVAGDREKKLVHILHATGTTLHPRASQGVRHWTVALNWCGKGGKWGGVMRRSRTRFRG